MKQELLRRVLLRRLLGGLALLALAFLVDRQAFGWLRTVTLYDHWGEMREGLTAAKFAASGLGVVLAGVVVGILDRRGWRRAGVLWLVVASAGLSGSVAKALAGRERPSNAHQVQGAERTVFHGPDQGLHHASSQSFPSGHTTSAFATATCLAAFYPPARWVLYAAACATGVDRVVEHQHFLSDAVAGALLGHLLALWLLARPRVRRWWTGGSGPAPPS